MKKTTSWKKHPCPIHRNWVDSSKTLDDSTRFARYVSTWFAQSSRLANRLLAWWIDNRGNDSCRFDRIESNRQHFQPTLHSPPEVKIRKITIHEPSSFLKRGHKPQSIRTIRVDSIESTQIDNIFNPPSKSRSTAWNRVHESISGLSNRKYQRRIDSSWVHWTTLVRGRQSYLARPHR